MTRTPTKIDGMRAQGALPVLCDVFGAGALERAVVEFAPQAVLHELLVLDAGGVVIRYGTFYGPGTYGGDRRPPPPRIRVEDAARRTVELLDAPSGVAEVVERFSP